MQLLPGVRTLKIGRLREMSYDPLRQQLLYDSMASLKNLEELTLPSFRGLERIGVLAGKLKRLIIRQGQSIPEIELNHDAAAGIAQLEGLEKLSIMCMDTRGPAAAEMPSQTLLRLLNHVPASLKEMDAILWRADDDANDDGARKWLKIIFENSVIKSVLVGRRLSHFRKDSEGLSAYTRSAGAIVASRAVGPQLDHLMFFYRVAARSEPPLHAPELAPLWELLRRCRQVEVPEIYATSVEDAVRAVARLGKPQCLVLRTGPQSCITLTLRKRGDPQAPWLLDARQPQAAAAAGPDSGSAMVPDAPQPTAPLPVAAAASGEALSPASLQCLAAAHLHRNGVGLAAAGAHNGTAGSATGSSGAASVAAAAPPTLPRLLVLRGAFLGVLAQSPEALTSWLRWLTEQRGTSAAGPSDDAAGGSAQAGGSDGSGSAGAGGDGGGGGAGVGNGGAAEGAGGIDGGGGAAAAALGCGGPRVASYQALPAANAVLLTCDGIDGALEAMTAAVSAAAQKLGGEGALSAVPAAVEGGEGEAEEVSEEQGPARRAFLLALEQVLQAKWDDCIGVCGGEPAAELALLRRLLSAWEQTVSATPLDVGL